MEYNFKKANLENDDRSYLGIRVNTANIGFSIKLARLFKENLVAYCEIEVDKENKAILIRKVQEDNKPNVQVAWTTINANLNKKEDMPIGRYLLENHDGVEFVFVYEHK